VSKKPKLRFLAFHIASQRGYVLPLNAARLGLQDSAFRVLTRARKVNYIVYPFVRAFLSPNDGPIVRIREYCPFLEFLASPIIFASRQHSRRPNVERNPIFQDGLHYICSKLALQPIKNQPD